MNPSFRVFQVDSDSKFPKDYLQYRLNITKANLANQTEPKWEVVYKATHFFNIPYLNDFEGISKFAKDIENNMEVYDKALEAFYSGGPYYNTYKNVTSMLKFT